MYQYEALANGIIVRAAKDYRHALKYLKKNEYGDRAIEAKRTITDCERFFQGEWIKELTDVDGNTIMQKIKEEIGK